MRVYPYKLEKIERIQFLPARNRWRGQKGCDYFDLTIEQACEEERESRSSLTIPEGYRQWLKDDNSILRFDELAASGEAVVLSLPKLYIPLETANPDYKPKEREGMHKKEMFEEFVGEEDADETVEEAGESPTISIEELLMKKKCILLRGEAGTGKTTLVRHLAYSLAQSRCPAGMQFRLPVPVFFKTFWSVFDKEYKEKRDCIDMTELLDKYFQHAECPLTMETVKTWANQNRAVFLFDGLDEIPKHLRPELVEKTANFRKAHKENVFLFTGRSHGVAGKAAQSFGKHLHDINPLNRDQVNSFIGRWFASVKKQAKGMAQATAESMISDMERHEHIGPFSENPLLLTALCILYLDGNRFPDQRADLYDRTVNNLIFRKFHDPADPEMENRVDDYLMRTAFYVHEERKREFDEHIAEELIKESFPKKKEEKEVDYKMRQKELFRSIEPDCGLLRRLDSGQLEFFHLSFQAFLAAKRIRDAVLDHNTFLDDEWWEEALLLYAGLRNKGSKVLSARIIEEIMRHALMPGKDKERLLLLAAKALRDFPAAKREETTVKNAVEHLTALIRHSGSLKVRFDAGTLLGNLGDPRIGMDNMVRVHAGWFIRGSNDHYDREKPERKIYLDEFFIGKFPVTNQEFREFIENDGYIENKFWTDEGWRWKEENRIDQPEYWTDRHYNEPNFPVIGISWYEAVAYAAWLSDKTGKKYRLPTEAEWEKGARGEKGRIYPWGKEFNKKFCNSYESQLKRTSPVGIFPQNCSPYNCMDMAGNVWEWCRDWYDEDYYKKAPDRNPKGPGRGVRRVDRGGSWSFDADGCRASYRRCIEPGFRDGFLGFRLVRSSC